MTSLTIELAAAREVAELGGRIAMGHFKKDPQRRRKDDGTWVTEADWAVEAQMRLRLARMFPEHNILGEEEGLSGAGGGPARPGAPTWVLDPIDGTNNYIAGIPIWATLVALQIDGASVVGVCHAPALGESYDAAANAGARMNGVAISVDPIDRLEDALVLEGGAKRMFEAGSGAFYERLARASFRTRSLGDFWGHMLVARGAAHVMIEPRLSIWDVAAIEVIVAEAGGRLSQLDGSPYQDKGSCLTTNGVLHDQILVLAKTP